MIKTVKVSAAFLTDREDRGLPCGVVAWGKGRKSATTAMNETLADMVDDAAYQGWFTDADAGTVRAARTAFRDLVKAGVPYRHGTKKGRHTDLLMPKDANDHR